MKAAPELFEPGEYLTSSRPGFFSILSKVNENERAIQKSYDLRKLPEVIKLLRPDINTWISQATFKAKNRQAVNLRDVGLLFSDLDTYHSEYNGLSPEMQADLLCKFCHREGLPTPSIILFSGRGLQVKWLLTNAVSYEKIYEWNQAQTALCKLLEPFAADMKAKDISRVLRVDRTVNTKSGQYCRVVYVTGGIEASPARYDFDELRTILVKQELAIVNKSVEPATNPALVYPEKKQFQKISHLPGKLSLNRLNWFRLYDIRDLWSMRGGCIEGYRELTLFWELNFLILADPGTNLWHEAQSLASQIDSRQFYRKCDLSTLYRKATELQNGAKVEYNGRLYPPMYTPRNETLINLFKITPDEEMEMRTIISESEHYRRKVAKRREAGILPREQYEAASIEKAKPWEALGISRRTWFRRKVE